MEQLDSHWTDFDEIWYLSFFRKSVDKIQVSLLFDNNNAYFTWRCFDIVDDISLNSLRMGNILDKRCRENQNTDFIFNSFFPYIAPFMR